MIPTYVVLSTHNRPDELTLCLESCKDADRVFCVDNASSPAVDAASLPENVELIRDELQPPNLSYLWNVGLDKAEALARAEGHSQWNIAVINDDAVLTPDWISSISQALRDHPTAVLAYGDQAGMTVNPILQTEAKPTHSEFRIVGYAHMSKGEIGLRFDERLPWWYGDDDYDWHARLAGGSLLVPGVWVEHSDPNGHTSRNPALAAQSVIDRETFRSIWKSYPM